MGKWEERIRCKNCGYIYDNGVEEVCRKCGTKLATKDFRRDIFGMPCMVPTKNIERIVAKRRWFRWVVKGE